MAIVDSATGRPLPALITGASGGIGADLARIMARRGHPLALVARSEDLLTALASELADELAGSGAPAALVVALDLESPDATAVLAARLAEAGFEPGILVNNAGYSRLGRVHDLAALEQAGVIDLNIRALTMLTRQFLPQIIARRGAVLNVASIAGFFPGPGMAVYYATKAYVLSFSRALGFELREQGVNVSALCPGPTQTGFFRRAGADNSRLQSLGMMASMKVAQAGYDGLRAGRTVIVPGWSNWILATFAAPLPKSLAMRIIGRLQMSRLPPADRGGNSPNGMA
jgi:uncharacterized protein